MTRELGPTLRLLHIASGDGWGGAERSLSLLIQSTLPIDGVTVEALLANEGRLAGELRSLGCPVDIIAETSQAFPAYVHRLRKRIQTRGYSVVHAHRYREDLAAALAMAPRASNLIITVHGLQPRSQLSLREQISVWGSLCVARTLGASFVAVSGELASRLKTTLRTSAVHQIPNPLPNPNSQNAPDIRARLGWPRDGKVVGFAGRLEHVKGVDLLIEIAAKGPLEARYVILGAGSLKALIVRRIRELGLGGRIAMVGEVDDATSLIRQFDVLALPSRHEGLPMVALEAAACQTPIVAFDVGGVREVLDGSLAAQLVAPLELDEFARALRRAIHPERDFDRSLGRWSRDTVKRYAADVVAKRYVALYRTVAHAKS